MTTKNILARRWVKILGGVVIALVLFLLLLPFGTKYYLADWLVKNGADSATIKNLYINPFTGRLTVGGVDVKKKGRSLLSDASMMVDLGLTSLFHRNIHLEKMNYHDLAIDLEQFKDGSWQIGSITVEGQEKQQKVVSNKELASRWNVLADDVTLTDCSVHLMTPDLDMVLFIDRAEIKRLTTVEGQPAGTFTFKGKLNNGPVELHLDQVQLVPELKLGGKVAVNSFQLKELAQLLHKVLPTLNGALNLDGRISFTNSTPKGMHGAYDGNVTLAHPDLANSDFSGKADTLGWKGKASYDNLTQNSPKIALDGLLAAQALNISVTSANLATKLNQLDLNGTTTLTLAPAMHLENNGSLDLTNLQLTLPTYGIINKSLSWKGAIQYESSQNRQGQSLHTDGSLGLGSFEVAGGQQDKNFTLGGQTAAWQGTVNWNQQETGKPPLVAVEGTLSGGELNTTLDQPQLTLSQEKVELKTKSTAGLGKEVRLDGKSALTIENFSLAQGHKETPLVFFAKMAIDELSSTGGKKLSVKDLSTDGLKATVAGNLPLEINIPQIQLTDIGTEDLTAFTLRKLQLQKPVITAQQNDQELARFDGISLSDLKLDKEGTVGANELRLQNLVFLKRPDASPEAAAITFANASLTAIKWRNDTGFQGDTLTFDDLVATIVRDKGGNINIDQQLARMQTPATAQPAESDSGSSAGNRAAEPGAQNHQTAPFKLEKVVVGGKSNVFFKDFTLAVPYSTDLKISQLEVSHLDSTRPDQKTELRLRGELEKRAPLEISGSIFPFKKKPGADLQMNLKNYPLSSLSAYTVQSVGTAMASGQLQLKSSLKLADDKLNMNNDLLLKKLKTKTISPKLAAELNNQLPIPLDAALSILRDNDDNIKLNVPLSGPVSKLNVGISDVLITALSKAIIPAASGYLTYALGPYGALAYVGVKVGEKMLQVNLPPVVFAPQKKTLTADHLKYLQRIGKILQDRPATDIQICPRVASWEFMTERKKKAVQTNEVPIDEKNRDQLLELGQKRAEAVQSLLQDKYGIAKDRLLICDTDIATKKDTEPAVLLQL